MATLARSALRARVAAAIGAVSGFSESRFSHPALGRDPNSMAHLAFSVGVGRSLPERRTRLSDGATVLTAIGVKLLAKLQPKGRIASYDAGLDHAATALRAALGISRINLSVSLASVAEPEVLPSGEWAVFRFELAALHTISLE